MRVLATLVLLPALGSGCAAVRPKGERVEVGPVTLALAAPVRLTEERTTSLGNVRAEVVCEYTAPSVAVSVESALRPVVLARCGLAYRLPKTLSAGESRTFLEQEASVDEKKPVFAAPYCGLPASAARVVLEAGPWLGVQVDSNDGDRCAVRRRVWTDGRWVAHALVFGTRGVGDTDEARAFFAAIQVASKP